MPEQLLENEDRDHGFAQRHELKFLDQARRGACSRQQSWSRPTRGRSSHCRVRCIPDYHDVRVREARLRRAQGFGEIATLANTDEDQHLLAGADIVLGTSSVLEAAHAGSNGLFAKMLVRPSRKIRLG